ncbi:MAG TPA: molybdenum cofactor guanylyltransferase MobA [Alphaproteobacteria bacterium]|nr:molybdenum cofactor guanylyltransferase MobA [Alphaproteobacteria bacterium]
MAEIAGVVLAGGLSRRMGGGDKCLRPLAGRAILARVIERARPQVAALMLNANGDAARFAAFALPVRADAVEGFAGPLAGVLTGMAWARECVPSARWLASFASDAPFLPRDLVARLLAALEAGRAEIACAASGGRSHPVFALWPVALMDDLRRALVEDGLRKVDAWTARFKLIEVEFACEPVDPFFNTNRPEDLAEAEALLQHSGEEIGAENAERKGRA